MVSGQIRNSITLAVGTALAAGLLVGCSGPSMALRSNSADAARIALARGKQGKAIEQAEATVAASPNDAASRVLLGQAYFASGRFASAATTFEDALTLGDRNPRTALHMVLARIGAGDQPGALAALEEWREAIPASDFGLALALAGEPDRGVAVLADALRSGDNSPKVRQNLAYSYALAGRWREARLMAAQDVGAEQVDQRIADWAASIEPEQYRERVATLLGTGLRNDPGQPDALALGRAPQARLAAAEPAEAPVETSAAVAAAASAPVEPETTLSAAEPVNAVASADAELPAIAPDATPVAAPAAPMMVQAVMPRSAPLARHQASAHFVAPVAVQPRAPSAAFRTAFLSKPVMHTAVSLPKRSFSVPAHRTPVAGTHLVQLGAFSTPENARRAWGLFKTRNPALNGHAVDIREAVINGRHLWRVAVAGLGGAQAANGLCSRLKSNGGECFAYSAKTQQRGLAPMPMQRGMGGPQLARR